MSCVAPSAGNDSCGPANRRGPERPVVAQSGLFETELMEGGDNRDQAVGGRPQAMVDRCLMKSHRESCAGCRQ